jgi:uncharacterized protein (DUF736 family)
MAVQAANLAAKGSIRKNEEKEPGSKNPDAIGSITFEQDVRAGTKLFVGAWNNVGQDGSKYVAVRLTFPQTRSAPARRPAPAHYDPPPMDDDEDSLAF